MSVHSFDIHSFIHFLNSQFSRTNAAEVHKHPLESAQTSSNSQQETRHCQGVKMKKPWWPMAGDSLTNWLSEWVIAFYTSQFGLSLVTWSNGYHQIRPWLLGCSLQSFDSFLLSLSFITFMHSKSIQMHHEDWCRCQVWNGKMLRIWTQPGASALKLAWLMAWIGELVLSLNDWFIESPWIICHGSWTPHFVMENLGKNGRISL